jgi:hypothetical protein
LLHCFMHADDAVICPIFAWNQFSILIILVSSGTISALTSLLKLFE